MKVVETLIDFYKPDDITTAKKQLVDDVKRLQLTCPQLRARRDADIHSRHRKEAEDIVDIISNVDLKGLMQCIPVYTVDNTDCVPTLKLEDGELRHFFLKIAKMEEAILVLQATVNKMYTCMCTSITHPDSSPRQLQSLLEASNTFIQPGHEANTNTRQLNTPAVEQTLRVQRKYESAPATGLRPLSVSNETRAPNSNLAINIDTSRIELNLIGSIC